MVGNRTLSKITKTISDILKRVKWESRFTIFHLAVISPNNVNWLIRRTTNVRLYSNISQILLLYKVSGYYNKFDSAKWLGYITDMSKCHDACGWSMDLEYITRYVQKQIAHIDSLFWITTGSRRASRGAYICETRLLFIVYVFHIILMQGNTKCVSEYRKRNVLSFGINRRSGV